MILSTIDEPSAIDRLWEDVTIVARARKPVRVDERNLLRALAGHGSDWYATRRGVQGVWSYADTAHFRDEILAAVLAKLETGAVPQPMLAALQGTAHRLHAREFEPYPACQFVCTQDPPVCLYRSAVADLVTTGRYQESWRDADAVDARSEDNRRRETWEVCQDAAFELVEFPDAEMPDAVKQEVEASARRVCLCFEQQMLADDRRKVPRTARRILARVLAEADL
jgi:hypothetical protein